MSTFFTSESVTEGHPDKLCDQVSDAVLDAAFAADPHSRVACECVATKQFLLVTGEIRCNAVLDTEAIARNVIRDIGYHDPALEFDSTNAQILVKLSAQSPDIAQGVDASDGKEQGAGDQGIMFGYASDETQEYMPLPISLAHRLARRLAQVRKDGTLSYLRPDGKTQVTVEYDDAGNPLRIDTVVVSTQHTENVSVETLKRDVRKHVIENVCGDLLDARTIIHINPTGRFVYGGPAADSGLTGRKIIIDTYGGMGRHGGGAFSGKDPSKVDRSGAYAARHVAKNIVAAGLAKKCEVQVGYAIGVAHPVSIRVETFGTGVTNDSVLENAVRRTFDLRPASIIKNLQLLHTRYAPLAAYGHIGRTDIDVAWERTNRVQELQSVVRNILTAASIQDVTLSTAASV